MFDYERMNRVLYRHEWTAVEEWVESVHALASMTDREIVDLLETAKPGSRRKRAVDAVKS
jgi:hypothetical protein